MKQSQFIPAYHVEEVVYHRVEDTPGVVIGLIVMKNGYDYLVSWQGRAREVMHEIELTRIKPLDFGVLEAKDEDGVC